MQEGIIDGAILQKQTKSALQILRDKNPDRILTLGGECATSIAPFSYLADKYKGDCVALIWLDAHPDLGLPH
ncbi:arginase [Helicobacter fennelliae]|uniref:Arginase n=1 Tax=Helicobacter fennelliae TaxID=215 RepID=A0A2X3DYM2_9HELI|nr:arginase family protein [Helicobacter fennelliae]SQC36362.1 arginase [Helicobacter fennelliae]